MLDPPWHRSAALKREVSSRAAIVLEICGDAPGQNIFVRGLTGTSRMTLIQKLLEDIRPMCPLARERCCVHNFTHPDTVSPR